MTSGKSVVVRLRKMRVINMVIISLCIFIIGFMITILLLLLHKPAASDTHRASLYKPKSVQSASNVTTVKGVPVSISIPRLTMSFEVIPGTQDQKGNWTLTWDRVQYATISPEPNNREGNTLIYGHATRKLFIPLYQLKSGDTASVTTDNGYVFHYKYEGTYAVSPHDYSVFEYKGAPILTLQTCSGTFFQNRQMYQFSFTGYEKV